MTVEVQDWQEDIAFPPLAQGDGDGVMLDGAHPSHPVYLAMHSDRYHYDSYCAALKNARHMGGDEAVYGPYTLSSVVQRLFRVPCQLCVEGINSGSTSGGTSKREKRQVYTDWLQEL